MIRNVLILLCFVAVGCDSREIATERENMSEYHGKSFRLSQSFSDYEQYTDSPDPIASDEHDRVSAAVRAAEMPEIVSSVRDLARAHQAVKFPGFEAGTLVAKDNSQTGKYYGMQVMIPYTEQSRFIVYDQEDAHLTLLQDAEADRLPRVSRFRVHPDRIEYFRSDGSTFEISR